MDNSNATTSLGESVALVLDEIKNIKQLHRSTHTKRLQFIIDACLVAHGVRTGYLVDAVCPPNPMEAFGTLLIALRRKSAVFKDVMFWHHTPTTQTFLVHVPLLQEKIAALLGGARECILIKLDKCPPSVLKDPPRAFREALYGLEFAMARSPDALVLSLSEQFAEELLIPLAGVVIDYPVAYFPVFSAQTFLEGEALDIYTVSFKWIAQTLDFTLGFGREHVLLKFSCPQVLASNHAELSPSSVIPKLRAKFAASLEHIGACISVTHRTETLERVAL